MTYSLTGMSTLGTVNKESSTKDANLFFQALPGSDSSNAIQLDLFGVQRTITIGGVYIGANTSDIQTFISQLDALCNGNQSVKTFSSDKSGASYSVLVSSVEWTSEEGAPLKIEYSITLQEGST